MMWLPKLGFTHSISSANLHVYLTQVFDFLTDKTDHICLTVALTVVLSSVIFQQYKTGLSVEFKKESVNVITHASRRFGALVSPG